VTPAAIVKTRTVGAGRADVWSAFTTSEGATTFFARGARIELRRGGVYEIYFNPDADPGDRGSEGCRVLSYLDGRMISFTWNAPPTFPELRWQRTFVVVELADGDADATADTAGARTSVTLTHAGWREGEEWEALFSYFDRAWDVVLGNLEKRFAGGPLWLRSDVAPDATPAPRSHYVYFIRPTRAGFFDAPTEAESSVIRDHAAYVRTLLARGRLILAGPAFDPPRFPDSGVALDAPTPGVVIFEAADENEAKTIMEADPAIRAGVFKAQVNRFSLAYLNDMGR